MSNGHHLWAVGFNDPAQAERVKEEVVQLGWGAGQEGRYLTLLDVAVVVCNPDGTFTLDRQKFPGLANILACAGAGLLAGLVLAAPLTGATVGAVLGGAGTAVGTRAGLDENFIRGVEAMMKPGTSVLFVLDEDIDMWVILHKIRGMGGTVLKTNVDLERARLVQSALAATLADEGKPD